MKRFKNKKAVIVACAFPVFTLAAIGITFAINNDWTIFDNSFKMGDFKVLFSETFDAPQNWQTCETIEKTITATNANNYDIVVRIKLEESWTDKDGNDLPLVSAGSGLTMAQIQLANTDHWQKQGDYYYYDTNLSQNQSSSSPIAGVTLNCDANRSNSNDNPGPDAAYADAQYHLKITAEAIDASNGYIWHSTPLRDLIIAQENDLDGYQIDFTKKAAKSDVVATANGNGVNKYTENGQDIYYYRGNVDNNNIVWADMCWKIIRTTATGGTKLIYNGPTSKGEVDGQLVKQCNATGDKTVISKGYFNYSNNRPDAVGYMNGSKVSSTNVRNSYKNYYFSKSFTYQDGTYKLDTSGGRYLVGYWSTYMSSLASGGYHYFCTNGASSCYASYFGYIIRYNDSTYIYHIPFTYGNYQSFDDIIADLASNKTDSSAKSAIDTWFTNNLANKEGDLEDTPFCNDRTITKGLLSSEESVVTTSGDGQYMYHGPYTRNSVKNASNNYEPSLDCRKVDAFTVEESDIGNGKLSHKVGLVTVDELTLSGAVSSDAYLASSAQYWTMSPRSGASAYGFNTSMYIVWSSGISSSQTANSTTGYRPVVSLKAGAEVVKGDGTKTNPYILKP